VSDSNVVMDRFSVDGGDTRIGLAAWRAATGQDQSSIIAAPAQLFVSFAGNDYHLSATSPARDAGATLSAVPDDLEGATRPQGPASDIGAYEFPVAVGPVQLTVTRTGSGTVTSTPGGVDCGSSCVATFTAGTPVSLSAIPAAGWVFTGWSGGGCAGTAACSLTLTTATTVDATFAPARVALAVVRAGLGSGSVTSAPAGIVALTVETVQLPVPVQPPLDQPVKTEPLASVAVRTTGLPDEKLAEQIVPHEMPAGMSCSTACFAAGTSVALTATPAAGAVFAGWSGACTGAGLCMVVMDQARAVTARFNRVFSDSTLTPFASVVRAVHVTELRAAIDTLRARQGLASFGWTDSAVVANATIIKRSHLVDLRSAVAAIYATRGLAVPSWSDPTITSAAPLVRASHIAELRAAVLALQ
jgi:Divergent InlB B-repeat domain